MQHAGNRSRGRPILHTLWLPLLSMTLMPLGLTAADRHSPRAIIDRVDQVLRGDSSRGVATMRVITRHWERSLTMEVWSLGADYSLVRVLSPAKEAGTSTLKASRDIWNYLPKVDRTIKIPASMMMGSWMGSHFTNDDLVKESRLVEDYEIETGFEGTRENVRVWEFTLTPRPEAAVVWGKIEYRVRQRDFMPLQARYFDEEGELVRTLTFSDFRRMGEPPGSGPHGHATPRQARRADQRELRRAAVRPENRQVLLLPADSPSREVSGHGSSFLVADRLAQSRAQPETHLHHGPGTGGRLLCRHLHDRIRRRTQGRDD